MPETGWEAAELLQRADPNARARAAQKLRYEDLGADLNRALEDRVFDPDPEIRALAVSLIPDLREPVSPDLLSSALQDSCPDVVVSAAEAFAILRFPRASDILTECLAMRPDLVGPLALALAKLEDPGAEDLLIDRLEQEDPAVRIAVLRTLGACGTARSVPGLTGLLRCGNPAVEGEALAALVRVRERSPNSVGRDDLPAGLVERALPALMKSRDRLPLLTGIAVVGWLRPPEGPALLLGLLESPDRLVRDRAREAFGAVAAGAERIALESIAAISDRDPAAAAAALDRVAIARDEESRTICLGLTRHADAKIRERAVALAGRSGGAGTPEALLTLAKDPVGHVRAQAAEALGILRWKGAGPALEGLLSDPFPDVRQAALSALDTLRDHEVDQERLFGAARGGPARAAALRACDPRRAGAPFQSAISDPDSQVRLAAAVSLNEHGVWLDEAAALLADEDPRVRAHALHARLKGPAALGLEPLAAFLRDKDDGVRQTFAIGLERTTGVERAAWLRKLLADPCAAVGRAAARALAHHRDPQTIGSLLDAVSTGQLPVAAQAIESLGSLGDSEALPRLRAVARGGDPALRDLAAHAIRRVEESRS